MNEDGLSKRQLLVVKNLSKSFPGVRALSEVDFDLYRGELHCIVGENGAGKSTFIKILSGALSPDHGEIYFSNKKYYSLNPHTALSIGINAIYQDTTLVPQLSVAENIFLGREHTHRFGIVDYRTTFSEAEKAMESLRLKIHSHELIENLSPAEQQFIKIIKSVVSNPKLLILDEPTATFDSSNTEKLLNLVKSLKEHGIGLIYISHHLEEIIQVADRITVLRDGHVVTCHDHRRDRITANQLAKEMVGRPVNTFYARRKGNVGEEILKIVGFKLEKDSKPVDFSLHKGEILGLAGMVGSGRSEILRGIFGANRPVQGRVYYKGTDITPKNPHEAIHAGFGFLTEDRGKNGLCFSRSILENISIVGLDQIGKFFLKLGKENKLVSEFAARLDIKSPTLNQEVGFLSGGNQQKVVLAKWLFKDVEILIIDEPTKGIDVNTKAEIYRILSQLVSEGKSLIIVSSEMPELISLCDRILVIRNGRISAELSGDQITEENILLNSIGRAK